MDKNKNAIPSTSSPEITKHQKAQFQPTVDTYVRVKPLEMYSSIHILVDSMVNLIEESQKTCKTNLFPKIFKPDSSQSYVFDNAVHKRIINFVKGESSSVIVSGMPGSGKTYTLIGNQDNPGIFPNAIKLLFSMVRCDTKPWCKVTMNNKIVALNPDEVVAEMRNKEDILNHENKKLNNCIEAQLYLNHSDASILTSEDRFYGSEKDLFSVWISLLKVGYDIYIDVLDPNNESYTVTWEDDLLTHTSTEYDGVQFRHVSTALDAYQLLISGLSKIESYGRSQRGFILTIKLLKYSQYTPECQDNAPVLWSTMTFYDCDSQLVFNKNDAMLANEYNFNEIFNINMKYIKAFETNESEQETLDPVFSRQSKFLQKVLLRRHSLSFIATIDISPLSNMSLLHDLPILRSWYLNSEEWQRNGALEAAQCETFTDDEKHTVDCIHDLITSWKSRNA